MFCTNCGSQVADGARFCTSCGAAIPAAAPQPAQPQYQQPQPAQPQSQYQQPIQTPTQGMKWFHFLIYFGLFAGAVINVINGIMAITGAQYDGSAKLVYRMIDGLQTLDVIYGLALLATAALGIYARFRLAGYRKNGPHMLIVVYLVVAIAQLVYLIGLYVVLPEIVMDAVDTSSVIGGIIGSGIAVAINTTYFKKRAHLFVND